MSATNPRYPSKMQGLGRKALSAVMCARSIASGILLEAANTYDLVTSAMRMRRPPRSASGNVDLPMR
jgi:hypothetical protein